MIVGVNYVPIKTNNRNNSINKGLVSNQYSFSGKFYPNKQLDEIIRQSFDTQFKNKKTIIVLKTRVDKILASQNDKEKKIFEKELIARAMELEPELRELRSSEYKKYYKKYEYFPPAGKIGLLKQEASDYANKKLLEILLKVFL